MAGSKAAQDALLQKRQLPWIKQPFEEASRG